MGIRLLIADDHQVVRTGLKSLLEGTDIEVIGEVAGGDDAIRLAFELMPDIIVLDVRMSKGDGLTALGRIKLEKPELPVLMLSTYDNPTYVARSVALGASGYLLKSVP
ncbi:MAG: response regulator transcription factor, partial [Planctomycetales bacterium]|nr:response regulator transcription factor [Planctomycetales bacterium]